MISLPDELKAGIDEFNLKHPYEKLNISQIAQKAIDEKIRSIDPNILKVKKTNNKNKGIESEVPLPKNEIQLNTTEKQCANCGNSFTPISHKAKFCSDKCKSADYRKRKKSTSFL